MAISPFDSQIYRELLCDAQTASLFSDESEIRSMVRVEAALARAQGELGLIPAASAKAIQQAADVMEIDPAGLSAATRGAGVPVPALVAAMRSSIKSSEHAGYLHHGATSQDIMDTGLILRLRDVCEIIENRLTRLLQALARQAETHAELPLAARTRAQIATPTSFGAVVASWGAPLLSQLEVLRLLKPRLLRVSLAGASGNASALGKRAAELRGALAAVLGLADSEQPWHGDRTALAEFSSLCTRLGASLARCGEDFIEASRPEVGELLIAAGGGSSTMPQKNNPIAAEMLVSLFRVGAAMDGLMSQAVFHRQQRDGVAWSLEWYALPQLCMATARALQLALEIVENLQPDADAMKARLSGGLGLVYAEAISFRLAETMPRAEAHARVGEMCAAAIKQQISLADVAAGLFPGIDWQAVMQPAAQLGEAPRLARDFAARVGKL